LKTAPFIVTAAAIAASLTAAAGYIGVATAAGTFWIDHTGVVANATVFEGSTLETEKDTASVQVNGGARILLEAGSRARVYLDHATLEKGRAQLASGEGYRLEALSMQVTLASSRSQAVVAINAGGVVEVGAAASQGEDREVGDEEVGRSHGAACCSNPHASRDRTDRAPSRARV